MTVADIKEYIDYQITKCTVINDKGNLYYDKIGINNSLEKIKSMLDELEPKAKWIIDEYEDYHCEKCNAIIEKDEWGRHNYNYCYHCGARMNDEVDNESSN